MSPKIEVHKLILAYKRNSIHFTFLFSFPISAYEDVYQDKSISSIGCLFSHSSSPPFVPTILPVAYTHWLAISSAKKASSISNLKQGNACLKK